MKTIKFTGYFIQPIISGEKIQTCRPIKGIEHLAGKKFVFDSTTVDGGKTTYWVEQCNVTDSGIEFLERYKSLPECKYNVGERRLIEDSCYGYVRIQSIIPKHIQELTPQEIKDEGVDDLEEFIDCWNQIYGNYADNPLVWVIRFSLD